MYLVVILIISILLIIVLSSKMQIHPLAGVGFCLFVFRDIFRDAGENDCQVQSMTGLVKRLVKSE